MNDTVEFTTLEEMLDRGHTVKVYFEKADGTMREMLCVSTPELAGAEYKYKDAEPSNDSESRAVWDLEKNAWRSFRWDSVEMYEVIR